MKQITKKDIAKYLNFITNQPNGFIYKDPKMQKEKIIETKSNSYNCSKAELLEQLYSKHKNCKKCPLYNLGKIQIVFGKILSKIF